MGAWAKYISGMGEIIYVPRPPKGADERDGSDVSLYFHAAATAARKPLRLSVTDKDYAAAAASLRP